MLNKHILPEFGERKLRSISAHDLQRFMNRFEDSSKSQITSALTTLQAIFADAKQDRIIEHNPAENLRRPNAKPPEEKRALTDEERARMLKIIPTHEYGLYLGVMYYTGMRPGEVRGLQWGDFDWDDGLIHVQRDVDYATKQASVGALKTASADRYIPIASELRTLLWPHRQAPGAFLFPGADGKPLAQTTATRMWIRLMVDCGMAEPITGNTCYGAGDIRGQYAPIITPHAMRHNFITMCWEQGLDILITMRLVGHADYQTTRNIYTHLSRKHLDDAKTQLDEMFRQKKSCTKVAQTFIIINSKFILLNVCAAFCPYLYPAIIACISALSRIISAWMSAYTACIPGASSDCFPDSAKSSIIFFAIACPCTLNSRCLAAMSRHQSAAGRQLSRIS